RVLLLDDFDDPARARLDQHRSTVHDRIAIITHAVFRRHVVIGDAGFGKHRAYPQVVSVNIGRMALLDDVGAKAGTLVDPENTGHATDDTAHSASDNGANGTSGSVTIARALLHAARNALRLDRNRNSKSGEKR